MNKNGDNKIRQSFDQLKQQAPSNLWDKISSDLEANKHNAPEENKVKESFQQLKASPPIDLWSKISSDLESNKHNLPEAKDENKIKESFQQLKATPPVDLWANLSQQLPAQETQPEGHSIKESFEQNYRQKAPDWLWNNVQKQLNIELVWTRISKALDKLDIRRLWRRRLLRLSSVFVLLLLLRSCGIGDALFTPPSQPNSPDQDNEIISKPIASEFSDHKQDHKKVTSPYSLDKNNNSQSDLLPPSNSQKDHSNNLGLDNYQAQNTVHGEPSISPLKAEQNFSLANQQTGVNGTNTIAQKGSVNEPSSQSTPNSKEVTPTVLDFPGLIVETPEEPQILTSKIPEPLPEGLTLTRTFQIPDSNKLPRMDITKVDAPLFELENEKKHKAQQNGKKRVEIGLIAGIGSSFLLYHETKNAWHSTSRAQTNTRPGYRLGISFHYFISDKDAVVANLQPFNSGHQRYRGYSDEGTFYLRDISMTHSRFEIGYQRTLVSYNEEQFVPSAITLSSTFGLGYLNQYKETVNDLVIEQATPYRKLDYSLGLALGHKHQFQRYAIGYGVYSNISLNNIFKGDDQIPATFKPTNLFRFGAYLSWSYRF